MGIVYRVLFIASLYVLARAAENAGQELGRFAPGLAPALAWIATGAVVLAAGLLLVWTVRIGRAWLGYDAHACLSCRSPTSYQADGRYGPYYHCWGCGLNRADR